MWEWLLFAGVVMVGLWLLSLLGGWMEANDDDNDTTG
jgi:hypothetical protein